MNQGTVGLCLLVAGLVCGSSALALAADGGAPPIPAASTDDVVQRGSELAHQFCAACHLFPEPGLLDRKTWSSGALRKMAPFLGVGQIRFEGRADGARLEASHLFPPTPLVTEAEWSAIREYYIRSAPGTALPQEPRGPIAPQLAHFTAVPILRAGHAPMTTLVKIDAGRHEVILGDAGTGLLVFGADGGFKRETRLAGGPVRLTAAHGQDLEGRVARVRGDLPGVLVTVIGHVFPSDLPEGRIVELPEYGGTAPARDVLTGLERPTDCVVADLDGDGRDDLLVCEFGNYLGRLSWFGRNLAGSYEEHVLLEVPGAIRAEVRDVDGDGRPDLLVLMAQGNEGLYLFMNQGGGIFNLRPLLRFQPAFGSTGFELADMNGDGFPDIVLTNGDNGEYPSPYKKYHGVRIYINDGKYNFTEAWFYPVNGAFKAVARDFDGDGDLDLAVVSFFPDYTRSPEESFVYLRHDEGGLKFSAQSLPEATAGRWITMDAADLDGDGAIDIVLGAFSQGPPAIAIPAQLQSAWKTNGVAGLILHNTTRTASRKAP